MKFTDKLYNWFYQQRKYSSRTLVNIINGASVGIVVWIFSQIFDRFIGLNGTFFLFLPYFVTGGMIIGAIIGMISNEIQWHKQQSAHKE